ncbi:MAG TPA: hypothetical protein VFW92_03480 [Candidatus Limnocylindrales bacterium]|nr:hypothetical protein [Candidatus Limnocylindrales bacterium]
MTGPELLVALVAEGLPAERAVRASASGWSNGPGDRYGLHAHEYDKVLVADAGSIAFELPDRGTSVTLEPGGRLELPAGTRHAALVGPRGVSCLELHLPAGSLGLLAEAHGVAAGRPAPQTDSQAAT